jgi:PAS domain S-box-containing protein
MNVELSSVIKEDKSLSKLFLHYVTIIILSHIFAFALYVFVWKRHAVIFHTFLELTCVFISLFIFLIVWLIYDFDLPVNHLMGFGFLAVSIFLIMHTIYFSDSVFLHNISMRYHLFSSLVEALTLISLTFKTSNIRLNKLVLLVITLAISSSVSVVLCKFDWLFPVLYGENGLTAVKAFLEYVIVIIFILVLYRIQKNPNTESIFANRNTYLAIMLTISSEVCFALFKDASNFFNLLGHMLKIASFLFLLKGILVNSIVYPYIALKDAKQKLEGSRRDLLEIFDQLPMAIVNYDDNGVISYVNQKAVDLLECEFKDIVGLTSEQFKNEFKAGRITDQSIVSRVLTNPKYRICDINTCRTKNGKTLKLNVVAFSYNQGILTVYEDIKKEQAITELRLQTYTILDSISNLVVMIDNHSKVVHCNRALLECIEMDYPDVAGKDIREIAVALRYTVNNAPFDTKTISLPPETLCEASLVTPTGKTKLLLQRVSQIINIDGEIIGYIIILTDITEMRDKEQKIQQQEKLALIGQMGSGIVHETKNLLAGIKGYCQLLLLKDQDEDSKKYIRRIDSIASDANKIVMDFLSLAKPTYTVMDITSLNEIVTSICYMIESPSLIGDVNIIIDLTDEDKDVKADESQMKQVILNLVKNAIEAMSETVNPHLIISTKYNKSKNEMALTIKDNGKGIQKENIVRLGDPFFTTKESGTGLGLSICYKIIREHSGHIAVESEPGKGTTFTISLPCFDCPDDC